MSAETPENCLIQGATQLSITLSEPQRQSLLEFVELLVKWNGVYNLTAVREPLEMVAYHLLDSLTVLPFLHGDRVVDIGCGAGLPGLVLAIMLPDVEFLLIDSNSKKTRFVQQAAVELGLTNVTVHHGRSEDYPPPAGFDTVVCRALATLPRLVELGGHLLKEQGVLVAQKGSHPQQELTELPQNWRAQVQEVSVPFLEERQRHIVTMRRIDVQD